MLCLISFHVVPGKMVVDIPSGPYTEGQIVPFTCEVSRVKGNAAMEHLWLTVGQTNITANVMENRDKTKHLLVREYVLMDAAMDGRNVTCNFINTFGDLQNKAYTIQVITGIVLTHTFY